MFGSGNSPTKDSPISGGNPQSPPTINETHTSPSEVHVGRSSPSEHGSNMDTSRGGDEGGSSPTRRRASGVSKARDMFSNAKNSISSMGASSPSRSSLDKSQQTPIQRLGKTDAALSVPQGSLNNAAGESHPTARSTFRVGVTEDKNKKCRRTMEDTHAYLYNFLATPAPNLHDGDKSKGETESVSSLEPKSSVNSTSSPSSHPVVESDNGYFAIFDGHAGTFAAEWCGKKLHLILEEAIRKNPNKPIPELLDATFTDVDQQLEKLPLKNSGCTAVIAVLRWEDRIPNEQSATGSTSIAPAAAAIAASNANDDEIAPDAAPEHLRGAAPIDAKLRQLSASAARSRVLYTANVGDARIVLCRNGKALRLSYDHKGSDDNEGKRIANAGGLILNNRVNGVLAVTRALGDAYMKDLVTGHPYTTETVIQADQDEFLILACDGLWDVCSDQEAVDLVRKTQDPQAASKMLVEHALTRFSTDNLSCMVVRFNQSALQGAVQQGSEKIGVEGDPATLVQGGVSEAQAIVNEARKTIPGGGESIEDLSYMSSNKIEEEDEADVGPELDPSGLKKAREKAAEGQAAATHEQ